jgi:hypothetical protein
LEASFLGPLSGMPTTRPKRTNASLGGTRPSSPCRPGSGAGSPYISHEWPADSLRFSAIHFRIASCASFMGLYGPRWTATAARSNRRLLLRKWCHYRTDSKTVDQHFQLA